MHASVRMSFSALIGLAALAACDRAPGDALAPQRSGPSTTSVAAASSGATIVRFSTVSFLLVFDAQHQLLSADLPSNICTNGGFNVVDVQRVSTPSQIGEFLAKVTGDEHVSVYHATSPADAGVSSTINSFGFGNLVDVAQFCAFMGGPNLIAEGRAQRLSTVSNASFHARWTGTLQGVDGASYHLTETYQLNADAHDPANPDTFTEPVVQILLHPIGDVTP